jgi:hypothetical protein
VSIGNWPEFEYSRMQVPSLSRGCEIAQFLFAIPATIHGTISHPLLNDGICIREYKFRPSLHVDAKSRHSLFASWQAPPSKRRFGMVAPTLRTLWRAKSRTFGPRPNKKHYPSQTKILEGGTKDTSSSAFSNHFSRM